MPLVGAYAHLCPGDVAGHTVLKELTRNNASVLVAPQMRLLRSSTDRYE